MKNLRVQREESAKVIIKVDHQDKEEDDHHHHTLTGAETNGDHDHKALRILFCIHQYILVLLSTMTPEYFIHHFFEFMHIRKGERSRQTHSVVDGGAAASSSGAIPTIDQGSTDHPEKKENDIVIIKPNCEEDHYQEKDVEYCNNSETADDHHHNKLSRVYQRYKEGEHIAVNRTAYCLFGYSHHGVVVGFVTRGSQVLTMVVHWQRPPSSQSTCDDHYYNCECGYRGPPKDGGYVISCLKCFEHGSFVFKIQHIGNNLLPPTHPKWKDNLTPGKVLYAGYCNNKFYLGYYSAGKFQGYKQVKKNDHKQKVVDEGVRFVETLKRSTVEVLKAAEDKDMNSKPYNLRTNNCEHAAMLIMTGFRRSFQLENCSSRIAWKIWELLCCYFRVPS